MPTQKKVETVAELRARIERAAIAIAAEYRGLSVTEMVALRRVLRDADIELRVVKNRLFERAAADAGQPELAELLEGPTAIIFGYGEITLAAKVATEYMRTARNAFAVRKGSFGGQTLSLSDLQSLASLPPREIMIGQFAGALMSPVANLAGLLKNVMAMGPSRLYHDSVQTFAGVLDARARQLESA